MKTFNIKVGTEDSVSHGFERTTVDECARNAEKPGERWELSPVLGIEAFNYNVAVVSEGERLSQNAYHYHENQTEFFHVVDGRCRVETNSESFDLHTDEVVYFDAGAPHLLHNPFEDRCKVIAIGSPPDGRYPVHQVQSYEDLLAERYPDGNTKRPSEVV